MYWHSTYINGPSPELRRVEVARTGSRIAWYVHARDRLNFDESSVLDLLESVDFI